MSVWLKKGWAVLLAAFVLAGCGGSGTSDDTDGETPTGPTPAILELSSDLVVLPSSGAESATLTALVKDSSNIVIPDVTVGFSASSGSLSVTQPTTDAEGKAFATLTTGGDAASRTITVTATVNGTSLTQTLSIAVAGSQLTLTGPSSMAAGVTQDITINLRNSANTGIPSETITLTSALNNPFSNNAPVTGVTGSVTVQYTSTTGGSETITATALDGTVVATLPINISNQTFLLEQTSPASGDIMLSGSGTVRLTWASGGAAQAGQSVTFTTTRGTIDGVGTSVSKLTDGAGQALITLTSNSAGPAVITASSASGPTATLNVYFAAATPSAIAVSASPASIGVGGQQSTISAVVRDASGNLVKGQIVDFAITSDLTSGSLSSASGTTDANGLASTVYTSSNTPSAQNGVTVSATVRGSAVTGSVSLTVAQSPLFITIGTGNSIQEPDTTTYIKQFAIYVTDSGGVARANQSVTVSVTPLLPSQGDGIAYLKGIYVWTGSFWSPAYSATCASEDLDQDGVLDVGEDTNADGSLTPGNKIGVGSLGAASATVTTDSTGYALVNLRYAQQYAYWMQVQIKASASVSGTESSTTQNWVAEGLASDFNKEDTAPPGRVFIDFGTSSTVIGSPFGKSATCADAL